MSIFSAFSTTWLWCFEFSYVKMMSIVTSGHNFSLCHVVIIISCHVWQGEGMRAPPPKGGSQMNIRVQLWCCFALSLKDPRHGYHIRVSGEAGVAMDCPCGFGWKHPVRTRKLPGTHTDQNRLPGRPTGLQPPLVRRLGYYCALTCVSSVNLINLILTRLSVGRRLTRELLLWKSVQKALQMDPSTVCPM